MDAVTTLREIWRCRQPVGVAAIVAILVGLALTYTVALPPESRKYEVGIASSRILVDTPDSQVVNVNPRGLETLGVRASVLANVMTEGEIKTIIAGDAGLRPSELRAGVEFEGVIPADLSRAAANPEAHLLTARTATDPDGVPLPIIEIEAQAPDSAAAVRLASAAAGGLRGYLTSKAASENVPDGRQLQVTGLGAPRVRQDVRGPKRLVALSAAFFVFLCGCAGILGISKLAPDWRPSKLVPDWRPSKPASGWRPSKLAPGWRPSKLTSGWRPFKLEPGWRPSKLAPGLRAKLVPGRRRADAASKQPTDEADASEARVGEAEGSEPDVSEAEGSEPDANEPDANEPDASEAEGSEAAKPNRRRRPALG